MVCERPPGSAGYFGYVQLARRRCKKKVRVTQEVFKAKNFMRELANLETEILFLLVLPFS